MAGLKFPDPLPGLVIQYSYLWSHEAEVGHEEGRKDRPVAIVMAITASAAGERRVTVLPITHRQPTDDASAVEIPLATKARLGLDDDRSWIVVAEGNDFPWPGPDVRIIPKRRTIAYGYLPPDLFREVRDKFLALDKRNKFKRSRRTT